VRLRRALLVSFLALGLALSLGSPLCAQTDPATGAAIVVEVNGYPITRADLDQALAMDDEYLRLQKKGSSAEAVALRKRIEQKVLELLIDEVLLTEAARNAKIALSPDEEREVMRLFEERVKGDWGSVEALEQYLKARGLPIERLKTRHRNGFLVRKLLHEEAGRAAFVRPAEIREYYEAHAESFREQGQVEISQIVVRKGGTEPDARALIDQAAKALAEGKPFADVAKAYPDGPNYEQGGKLVVQSIGALKKELRETVEKLKEGETSPIIETKDAYMLVRVDRIVADRVRPFEEVQDEIYERLEDQARIERFESLKRRLRDKAFIKRK
jgi:parvulin-like peptidyl-prolyl isomerase